MTNFFKKIFAKAPTKAVSEEIHTYIEILQAIHTLLLEENHIGQANVVASLLNLLRDKQYKLFATKLNTVDMWGGSGAVWEVGFENSNIGKLFKIEIIRLINLMEVTGIASATTKRIKTLFTEDVTRI